jgi:phosphoglycolate phosphatase-like HAD superfamily hydrolase
MCDSITVIRVVVFDFDGVIVDSNDIKRSAYFKLFSLDFHSRQIVEDVLKTLEPAPRSVIIGAILNRLEAFKYKGDKEIHSIKVEYEKRYGEICLNGVSLCPEIKGATESLKMLSVEYELYLNSLTPLEPLKLVLRNRGLTSYFKDVFGSNKSKIENLKHIIAVENITPRQVVVVGDGVLDVESASACGTHFIGIENGNGVLRDKGAVVLLPDCDLLVHHIKKISKQDKS